MEQPQHDLRSSMRGNGAELAPRRFGGLVIVTAVHVGIGALLILGMKGGEMMEKMEDLVATVEQQLPDAKPPPPPPPDVVKPPPPFVPPPDIAIAMDAPAPTNTISATSVPPPPRPATPPAPPAPPRPPEAKLSPIQSTRTKPPYPTISQRLGEQGTTEMIVTINTEGRVTAAEVTKSSGSKRLDDAAVAHVTARWRWTPPTLEGKPVDARQIVRVEWSLKDAQ
jgi:protein TonB